MDGIDSPVDQSLEKNHMGARFRVDRLGLRAEQLYGKDSMGPGFSRPFANLYRIHHELASGRGTHLTLTQDQERSFWNLWEWWTTYMPFCQVADTSSPSKFQRFFVNGQAYELKVTSFYFHRILGLFVEEFLIEGATSVRGSLRPARDEAAEHSACQHIAKACLRHWVRNLKLTSVYKGNPVVERELLATVKDSTPSPLAKDDPAVQAYVLSNTAETIRERLQADDLAGLDRRCTSGASCGPCPWLPETDDLPFFLWDIQAQKVVEVNDLASRPSYVAISHTWGRWRKPGAFVHVIGVQGWSIPENTLFDVANLPQILSAMPVTTRYVWFDLVCIPQDYSDRAFAEISRQAAIFKNAMHVLLWLNTVERWLGLRHAVELMAIQCLQWENVRSVHTEDLATGLFEEYNYAADVDDTTLEINGWFSSLWTLQEVCLRPDMWLCNKSLELFTVAGSTTPVALNTIVALTSLCTKLHREQAIMTNHPDSDLLNLTSNMARPPGKFRALISRKCFQRGYLELAELFDRTGMDNLFSIDRGQIMLLGSNRFCLENRAEAIMSVLDVKNWRADFVFGDPRSHIQKCVLQQYPLEFVQEVASVEGAKFFNSISTSSRTLADVIITSSFRPSGSILPFHTGTGSPVEMKFILDGKFANEEDNPIVRSWVINDDGSVSITRVGVLTSSEDCKEEMLLSNVWHTYDEPDQSLSKEGSASIEDSKFVTVDLREWCKAYHPYSNNYAVELTRIAGTSRGILLKEIKKGSSELFKIGNYMTSSHYFLRQPMGLEADIRDVDWAVL